MIMKKIELNNFSFYYKDLGKGDPVVLVHGMASDHTVWELIKSQLKKDYRLLLLDLRGHGLSSKTPGPYSIELFAQDLNQFLEALEIEHAHFIGHSMGGAIVQEMALQYPTKTRSLTLISSFARVDSYLMHIFNQLLEILDNDGFDAFFDRCLELVYTPQFMEKNRELFQEIKEMMRDMTTPSSLENSIKACMNVDLTDSLQNISQPTHIIVGEKDIFTPIYHSMELKKAITHALMQIIEGVGHNLLVERPDDAYAAINNFLKGLSL